jgi:hypothetical protein
MIDPVGLTTLLKPYLPILVFIISAILVTEVILLKTDIFSRRWHGSHVGWKSKQNKKVNRTLTWIILIYRSLGFTFKSSSTIREVISDIVPNLPSQSENLNFILHSLEDHIYGGSKIGRDDFIYHKKWVMFAKAHTKSR